MSEDARVLDPFCGTGTTLVECKKLRVPSLGFEANPFAHFAGSVKIDWSPVPDALWKEAEKNREQRLGSEPNGPIVFYYL